MTPRRLLSARARIVPGRGWWRELAEGVFSGAHGGQHLVVGLEVFVAGVFCVLVVGLLLAAIVAVELTQQDGIHDDEGELAGCPGDTSAGVLVPQQGG